MLHLSTKRRPVANHVKCWSFEGGRRASLRSSNFNYHHLMASLELLSTLDGHKDRVWHLAWSPDGKNLASCGADKTIRIWGREGEFTFLHSDGMLHTKLVTI